MTTYVITFDSTECAMDASDALTVANLHFRTLPTPRAISAGCGIALRIDGDDQAIRDATTVLEQTECGRSGSDARSGYAIYRQRGDDYEKLPPATADT